MGLTRKKVVILSASLVVFLVFFSSVQYGLSAPITGPIVVKMDNSSEVNLAVETLQENTPNSMVVEYDSPVYYLVIWRAYSGVIWVGHGSQEGMNTQQGILAWQALATRVESTPSKDAILACYSTTILSYVDKSQVIISFKGEMDAKLGALLVSYAITGDKATLGVALQQISGLLGGNIQPVFLGYRLSSSWLTGYDTGLTDGELVTLVCEVICWVIFAIVLDCIVPQDDWAIGYTRTPVDNAMRVFVCEGIPSITSAVLQLGGWLDNRGSTITDVAGAIVKIGAAVLAAFVSLLVGAIVDCFSAAISLMNDLFWHNFWLWLLVAAVTIATVLIPAMIPIKLGIAIGGIGFIVAEFINFYLSPNSEAMSPPPSNSPPSYSPPPPGRGPTPI